MRTVGGEEESLLMTSSPSPPDRTIRTVPRGPLDDDMARALIRARVRRQHRRAHRVLTRA
jgi:hypothetical protein